MAKKQNLLNKTLQAYADGIGNENNLENEENKVNEEIGNKIDVNNTVEVKSEKIDEVSVDGIEDNSETSVITASPSIEIVNNTPEEKAPKSVPSKKEKKEVQPKEEEKSVEDVVKEYIKKIEEAKTSEKRVNLSFVPGVKIKFDDKYPIFSSPARPEIHEVIDYLCKNSSMKKYEIFELLIFYGLNSIFNNGK